jgi:hypothetical protein
LSGIGAPDADLSQARSCSTLQQLQHLLRQLVGLRHHGSAGLLQDVGAAQVAEVSIA